MIFHTKTVRTKTGFKMARYYCVLELNCNNSGIVTIDPRAHVNIPLAVDKLLLPFMKSHRKTMSITSHGEYRTFYLEQNREFFI